MTMMRTLAALALATAMAGAPALAQQAGQGIGIDARASQEQPGLDDFLRGLQFWAAADIWMLGDLRSAIQEVSPVRNEVRVFALEVPAAILNGPTDLGLAYALSRNNRRAVHDTVADNGTLVQKLAQAGFTPADVEVLNFYADGVVLVYVLNVTD